MNVCCGFSDLKNRIMKKTTIIIALTLLCVVSAFAFYLTYSSNSTPTKFTTWLGVPTRTSSYIDTVGGLRFDRVQNRFIGRNNTIETNIASENYVNANFIPGSSADKTKLDAITGTNTGDNALSFADGGLLSINGANANTVNLNSLAYKAANNGLTIPATAGVYVQNITGGTNYPTGTGQSVLFLRTGGSLTGAFRITKAVTSNTDIFFETANGTAAWNTADIIAGRSWVAASYPALATANIFTANQTMPRLVVGTGSLTATNLRVDGNITGAATAQSFYAGGAIQSDVTTTAIMFRSIPSSVNSVFTTASVVGFRAANLSKGASHTVTSQYGMIIDDLAAGTSNFGIASTVSSGANKWNWYGSGTASNYSAGKWLMGTLTDNGVDQLQVAGGVAATQYKVSALNTAPASATATGTLGEIRFTSTAIFVCIATNTWVKANLATF